MDYMTTIEASKLWNITIRQVQSKCDNGKVEGIIRIGRMWLIPKTTHKPIDGRTKEAKNMFNKSGEKK